jgi:hypothetical protein
MSGAVEKRLAKHPHASHPGRGVVSVDGAVLCAVRF